MQHFGRIEKPTCLVDLTKDIYKKSIILMDARTSTPGLGFVAWTLAQFGDAAVNYWYALRPNILTMATLPMLNSLFATTKMHWYSREPKT